MAKQEEWSSSKKWNPFNSYKLLSHVERWKEIKRHNNIPQPILITVDPVNVCNLKCVWCNADYILQKSKSMFSRKSLMDLAAFLPKWKNTEYLSEGVKAICIAGGGEPLLHPNLGEFIDAVTDAGIEVGVVTNGVLMDRIIPSLAKCTWVGVSVDAGTAGTFKELKKADAFDKVIKNMQRLIKYSRDNKSRLGMDRLGYGVTYKYLLHPSNVHEIEEAARLAKESGCSQLHIRPAGVPWDKLGSQEINFTFDQIDQFYDGLIKARQKYEDEKFGVFGITHKFDNKLSIENHFSMCHAIFMTAVFMPGTERDTYTMGLCCDRRGDAGMQLVSDSSDYGDVQKAWGNTKHWEIFDRIKVDKCPRCTYQPHNQIYEQVILNDSMTWKFI